MSTEFQTNVWHILTRIPCGRVVTYIEMARVLRCGSPRAIGQALKRNPHAPQVPCHRVIRADHTIGGYSGAIDGEKLQQKKKLLASEGVTFLPNGKLADPAQIYQFPEKTLSDK